MLIYHSFTHSRQPKSNGTPALQAELRETKGIFDVIRVWRLVVNALPDAQLLVMGSGSPQIKSQLTQFIEAQNLGKNVTLFGHAKPPQLAQNMKNSQIFVTTSHEEGWGIALCEAIACGLKVHGYALPAFQRFNEFMEGVDKFDEPSLANNIVNSLKKDNIGNKHDGIDSKRLIAFEQMVSGTS